MASEIGVQSVTLVFAADRRRCGASPHRVARVFETSEGQERFVKNGGDGMPEFGQVLSDDEIRDAVALTREKF